MTFKISSEKIEEFIEMQHAIDGMVSIHDFELWLEEQPRVGEWIPCSERLPEDNIDVLIQPTWTEDVWHLERASYEDDKWHCCCNTFDKEEVIAWMPLPEPYKVGDQE